MIETISATIAGDKIAVDPVNGLIAVNAKCIRNVMVTFHYAFSADMGGGEYQRPIRHQDPSVISSRQRTSASLIAKGEELKLDLIDQIEQARKIGGQDQRDSCPGPPPSTETVVEFLDSRVYKMKCTGLIVVQVKANEHLVIRSANRKRPVIHLNADNCKDGLVFRLCKGSQVTLEGVVIAGNCVKFCSESNAHNCESRTKDESFDTAVNIRHCTIRSTRNCSNGKCDGESLTVELPESIVRIQKSIVGNVHCSNESQSHETRLSVTDSIVGEIKAATKPRCNVRLRANRSTFFGVVTVQEIYLVENCIFTEVLRVKRTQSGGIRYSHVPTKSTTPGRFYCQPDLAVEVRERESRNTDSVESLTLEPKFTSKTYNDATFAQLDSECPIEIRQGAEDESEMGAFHDLYQAQREANLRQRLNEFSPISHATGIKFAN